MRIAALLLVACGGVAAPVAQHEPDAAPAPRLAIHEDAAADASACLPDPPDDYQCPAVLPHAAVGDCTAEVATSECASRDGVAWCCR